MATIQVYDWTSQGSGGGSRSNLFPYFQAQLSPEGVFNSTSLVGTPLAGGNVLTGTIVDKNGLSFDVIIVRSGGKNYYLDADGGTLPTSDNFSRSELLNPRNVVDVDDTTGVVACFARGTLIDTPDGPRPIEDIAVGDLVNTLDRGPQPVRWTGCATVPARGNLAPIRIAAGALGPGLPVRDLLVSPAHRMAIRGWRAQALFGQDEILVATKDLVNETTIRPSADLLTVDYHHIMFDRHELVIANGAPSESFHPASAALDDGGKDVLEEIRTLFPQLRGDLAAYGGPVRPALSAREARLLLQ